MSETSFGGVLARDATTGIGYGTGAGGAVTQLTNKYTGVTLNTASGQITMANTALATGTAVGFVLTNSAIASTDTVVVNIDSGAATSTSYLVGVNAVGAGSCTIVVHNLAGPILSEALVLNFAVVKAVAA